MVLNFTRLLWLVHCLSIALYAMESDKHTASQSRVSAPIPRYPSESLSQADTNELQEKSYMESVYLSLKSIAKAARELEKCPDCKKKEQEYSDTFESLRFLIKKIAAAPEIKDLYVKAHLIKDTLNLYEEIHAKRIRTLWQEHLDRTEESRFKYNNQEIEQKLQHYIVTHLGLCSMSLEESFNYVIALFPYLQKVPASILKEALKEGRRFLRYTNEPNVELFLPLRPQTVYVNVSSYFDRMRTLEKKLFNYHD